MSSGGIIPFSEYYKAGYDFALFDGALVKNVIFAPHNLVTDNAFNEFQLIVCRNVLIYFNQDLQNRVVRLFYESLCNFGFLALGNKESLLFMREKDRFQEIDKKEKIFIKKH
jgi:chemotaxis protein methyltransferase CheR